jgi:hypothetical protein
VDFFTSSQLEDELLLEIEPSNFFKWQVSSFPYSSYPFLSNFSMSTILNMFSVNFSSNLNSFFFFNFSTSSRFPGSWLQP